MSSSNRAQHPLLALLLVGFIFVLLFSGHRYLPQQGFQVPALHPYFASGRQDKDAYPGTIQSSSPSRRILIQSGGVPREGFGSTLNYIKDAVSMAYVLDRDVTFAESAELFGYQVTSLLRSDNLKIEGSQHVCDLHNTILEDRGFGTFLVRYERAHREVDQFKDSIASYCMGDMSVPYEMLPHIRTRLASCDVLIWADQGFHTQEGWTACTRPWLKKTLGMPPPRKRTIGIHYRWGDISTFREDHKWLFNNTQVETILRAIRKCDSRFEVSLYMKPGSPQETPEERQAAIQPMTSWDKHVDSGDDLKDLVDLASHDILILNAGAYSEAAAAASSARVVIHNGHWPHIWKYLTADGTLVFDTAEASELDWCKVLENLP